MSRWQRPPLTPVPWRQALEDKIRRTDPRILTKRLLIVMLLLLFAQLGWQWRTTTLALGQRQTLVVMERSVSAGSVLGPDDTRLEAWPVGLAPDGALSALPDNAVASTDLVAGEVLVAQRLFPTENGLSDDEMLITIPQPLAPPPVERGSMVDLFGILPIGDGLTSPATRLATGTVMTVTDSAISVAVPVAVVPTIIEYSAIGVIDVAIRP